MPTKRRIGSLVRNGQKRCSGIECKNPNKNKKGFLPTSEFTKARNMLDGLCHYCKWCSKKSAKKCNLKSKYGLSIDEYTLLLKKQNGRCAICGTSKPNGNKKVSFSVDHNHITGKIRGLLCVPCNVALGLLKTDSLGPLVLLKAIKYLKNNDTLNN